ncbi:MAG: alpha-L-fucosidase [Alicyclobacillus sp.]|nr:alpha-L-fucosidase [Alicyclobacillus sp.]
MEDIIRKASTVTPSERQLKWHALEFYGFIHFSVNTFTDREWGLGNEDPQIFNPSNFDPHQWVDVCKSAGMKGLILTCKHHDGFCLWPSAYTDHSVKNSPWKSGKGDVVKEVADACRAGGIKFGIYLSPWDRHDSRYGSPAYNQYFMNQLRELLSNYGEIFCVWLDGACGEGPNGQRQVYDWDGYYQVIRELQPDAVISVCGPDVRWCGNEAGHCRESEWCVVPASLQDCEKIQEASQHVDDGLFAQRVVSSDEDLGSREVIRHADKLVWYPAEVNTSIRPGWFYHPSEDDKVKSVDELLDIYYKSVGGNANFLLNVPPDRRGLIHERDAATLAKMGEILRATFRENLAADASATASQAKDQDHQASNILNRDGDSFWCTKDGIEQAVIEINLHKTKTFDRIVLMEHIPSGQRIEKFKLEYKRGESWIEFFHGTVIGYKRICRFPPVTTTHIRLCILESRWSPTLSRFEVYYSGASK